MSHAARRTFLILPVVFGVLALSGCEQSLPHIDGNEVEITADNFDAVVLQSDLPVLIDFWAEWCGPCRELEPVVAHLSVNYADRLKVGKVNTDEQPELSNRFQVSAIPMLALFHNGELVASRVGSASLSDLSNWVDSNVPSGSGTADSGN